MLTSTACDARCPKQRRKSISEKDFMDAINKVVKSYRQFSSTPKYMVYN